MDNVVHGDGAAQEPESTPADAPRGGPSPRTLVVAAATGLAVLVGLVLLADGRELLATAAKVHPSALLEPLVFSALSYAAMSRSYQGITEAAGCRRVLDIARAANPAIIAAARAHDEEEAAFLEREQGMGLVVMGEREIALGMADFAMTRLGVPADHALQTVEELRAGR